METAYYFQIGILFFGIIMGCAMTPTKTDAPAIAMITAFVVIMIVVDIAFLGGHAIRDKLLFSKDAAIKGHGMEIIGLFVGVAIGKAFLLTKKLVCDKRKNP